MKITGNWATREVLVNGKVLDPGPSQELCNHSPDGFSWGYHGSGPAQLALAILLEAGIPANVALGWHQNFKRAVVAGLPNGDFSIDINVHQWLVRERLAIRKGNRK